MSDIACIVCHRHTLGDDQPQTCTGCLARTRSALIEIEQLYALLPDELEERAGAAMPIDQVRGSDDPLPGGDAMVMLGPGSTGWHSEALQHGGDPDSVLGLLERWETDWRITFGHGAATDQATISGCVIYLTRHLARASQDHPAFDEFSSDVTGQAWRMRSVLRSHPDRSLVPCITCRTRSLERPQERTWSGNGTELEWQCSRCHRMYTGDEFWVAVRHHGQPV